MLRFTNDAVYWVAVSTLTFWIFSNVSQFSLFQIRRKILNLRTQNVIILICEVLCSYFDWVNSWCFNSAFYVFYFILCYILLYFLLLYYNILFYCLSFVI